MPPIRNNVSEKLRAGDECVGSFVFSPDAAHTEIIGTAGLDFVIIDLEHAPLTIGDVISHVRAAKGVGVAPFVRVRHSLPADIGRLLDVGVEGIVFPHVGLNLEATRESLQALRYQPRGNRPTCTSVRAAAYGLGNFSQYVEQSNENVIAIGLVEDHSVVERIDEVLEECDIDVIVPGAGDLATSLGVPGQLSHPVVVESLERVIAATKRQGRAKVGLYITDLSSVSKWRDFGVELFILSTDYRLLANTYREAMSHFEGRD